MGGCETSVVEAGEPNNVPEGAEDLALDSWVLGTLSAVTDVDWYRVQVPANAPLLIRTDAYCDSDIDTELSVFTPDGNVELAWDGSSGRDEHGLITYTSPDAGPLLIRVQSDGPAGRYLLMVEDTRCTGHADCSCADQVCSSPGPELGACEAALTPAASGTPGTPYALVLDQRMVGEIAAPTAIQRFEIDLSVGYYDIISEGYCAYQSDTYVEVVTPNGELLGADDDSGEALFGALLELPVAVAGTYEIRVRGYGGSTGRYVLSASLASICVETACTCPLGQHVVDGSCEFCPSGGYCAGGIAPLSPCTDGTQDADGNAQTPCVACPSTQAGLNGQCQPCPDGTRPNVDATTCEPCPAPTVGTGGSCETVCATGQLPNITRTACELLHPYCYPQCDGQFALDNYRDCDGCLAAGGAYCHGGSLPDLADSCQLGAALEDDCCGNPACNAGQLVSTGSQCPAGSNAGGPVETGCAAPDAAPCTTTRSCYEAQCDLSTGACVEVPSSVGSSCDDADVCTTDDQCAYGVCAGSPLVCTSDNPCLVASCDSATGACALSPRADDSPCDDDNACTQTDRCQAGSCQGSNPIACAAPGPCETSACAPESGLCVDTALSEGASCDDGDHCTAGDVCTAGTCSGVGLATCGQAAPSVCEGSDMGIANPVALSLSGGVMTTVHGYGHGDGDTDGWLVSALQGQTLQLVTRPQCSETFDVSLSVTGSTGESLALTALETATAGAGPEGVVTIPATGQYRVDVTSETAGAYFLDLMALAPSTCVTDADCGCGLYQCERWGDGAGSCVLAASESAAASPSNPQPIGLDTHVVGSLSDSDDVDSYQVTVPAHVEFSLGLRGHCDSALEASLSVIGPDGEQLAMAESSVDERLFVVASISGDYVVTVSAGSGPYLLDVADERCTLDADCGCSAKRCVLTEGVGRCVPAYHAPELATATTLSLATSTHALIDAVGDQDSYEISLGEGVYTVSTSAYCGDALDTILEVSRGGNVIVDDDSGEDFFSAVHWLPVPEGEGLVITVRARGAETGPYLITVAEADACLEGVCLCPAGQVLTGTICTDCESGHYCPGGVAPAQPCPAGTWDADGSAVTPCDACAETAVALNGACSPCPDGTQPDATHEHCVGCSGTTAGLGGRCDLICGAGTVVSVDKTHCVASSECHQVSCPEGHCTASALALCGATPSQCEVAPFNDLATQGDALQLTQGSATLVGGLSGASDIDWYRVSLSAGQSFSAAVTGHCGGSRVAQVALFGPDDTLLASSDSEGSLGAVTVSESGYYALRVSSSDGLEGAYHLAVTTTPPSACAHQGDCGCAELVCTLSGSCAYAATEIEPNDDGASATTLGLGAYVRAALQSATDVDWFSLNLSEGVPVALDVLASCQASPAMVITLYAPAGDGEFTEVLSAQSSIAAPRPSVDSFTPPVSGSYRLKVHAQGLELGAYVLALRDISCHSDEGCGCADQRCTGDALNPGACVPQHATVESGAGQGSAQALVVGQRSWARLDAPGDVDVFQVALEPGIYDLKSVAYCGSDTDTKVTLRDSNYQALVSSDDGGEGVYGAILAYRVVSNASFFIEVSGYGATIGDYQVEALLAPECHGTGCLCSPGSVWIQGACQTCAAGHYCAGGASLMAPCELGSWDHDGQPASPCQPCAPGTIGGGLACTPCPDGSTPDSAGVSCTACPALTVGSGGQCQTTCGEGSVPNSAKTACVPQTVQHPSCYPSCDNYENLWHYLACDQCLGEENTFYCHGGSWADVADACHAQSAATENGCTHPLGNAGTVMTSGCPETANSNLP